MMNPTLRRAIALPMLTLVTACSSMQPVAQPREFLQARQPAVVWLSKDADQTMVAVDAPRLLGDSIVGFVEGEYTEIPIASVRSMQAKQYSRSKTVTFLVGVAAATAALIFVVAGGTGSGEDMNSEDDVGILPIGR